MLYFLKASHSVSYTHLDVYKRQAQNTHRVIDVENCFIQKQKNNEIAAVVRQWMKQYKIAPYDEDARTRCV